jgi:hypothetical protein
MEDLSQPQKLDKMGWIAPMVAGAAMVAGALLAFGGFRDFYGPSLAAVAIWLISRRVGRKLERPRRGYGWVALGAILIGSFWTLTILAGSLFFYGLLLISSAWLARNRILVGLGAVLAVLSPAMNMYGFATSGTAALICGPALVAIGFLIRSSQDKKGLVQV